MVHDGRDYLNFAVMKTVLDNLIERLEIPDMIVVVHRLARSHPRVRRTTEQHARFLTEELLPEI